MARPGDEVVTESTTLQQGILVLNRSTGLGNRNLPNGTIVIESGTTLLNNQANQIGDLTTIAISNATLTFNAPEYFGGLTMRAGATVNGGSTFVLNGTQTAGLNAVGGGNAGTISANLALASDYTDGSTANNPRTGNGTTPVFVDTGTSVTISGKTVDGLQSSPIGSMTKSGAGTLILSGNGEYRGTTTVTAGELQINGTNQAYFWNGSAWVYSNSGAVSVTNASLVVNGTLTGITTIGSGSTLGGTGSMNTTTIQSGGMLSPGNSPGLLTMTNGLTLATDSAFEWELLANSEAGRGSSFDGVNVTGGQLTINTGVTSALVFNTAGSSVLWSDGFWASDRSWLVFSNAISPSLSSGGVFDAISMSVDGFGNTLNAVSGRESAYFSWGTVGNDVFLNYHAAGAEVPEPATWVAGLLLLSGVALARWRRLGAR